MNGLTYKRIEYGHLLIFTENYLEQWIIYEYECQYT